MFFLGLVAVWLLQSNLFNNVGAIKALAPANATSFYDMYVVNCFLYTEEDHVKLHELVSHHDVDLWSEGVPRAPAEVKIMTNGDQLRLVKSDLVCDKAISLNLYEWMLTKGNNLDGPKVGFFDDYQAFSTIQRQLNTYAKTYPSLVRNITSIGTSLERRAIPVIHITAPSTPKCTLAAKKTIWVSGGQHAREWIAPAAVMYVIEYLLKGYNDRDPQTVQLMEKFEFVLAPVINPDGYEYSRTQFRYWRKNRRNNLNGSFGVDLNRNWDNHWNEVGASMTPSSDIFCGRTPASEPEVALTQAYILNLPNRAAGIDVHSYGALVLRNFGWTLDVAPNEIYLKRLGDAMANAMNLLYDSQYTSERSSYLYPSGGSMDDWMFEKSGMPGFTIELRDHGEYGFLLPAKFIIPTGKELLAAVKTLGIEILKGQK